jgi:hypothetical protein
MLVKATNKYEELNLKDSELGRMPKQGEEFEVTEERYEILTKTNRFNTVFVKKVEEVKETDNGSKDGVFKKTRKKK